MICTVTRSAGKFGDDLLTFHSDGITWNHRRYCYNNSKIGTADASWIMMEYSLDDPILQNAPYYTVLCRIRKKKNKNNCGRKRKSAQSNPQTKPPKRQLKKAKSESRIHEPLVEETVQVTAPPPHVPVHVPLSENLLYALDDSCFNEKKKIAIDSVSCQMKTMEAKLLYELNLSTPPVEEIIRVTTPPVDQVSTDPVLDDSCFTEDQINAGDDGYSVDCERQQHYVGEDDDVHTMHSILSGFLADDGAASSCLLQETDFDGGSFDFEDWDSFVSLLQASGIARFME